MAVPPTENELPSLIAEQQQLLTEERIILEMLARVKEEMHKLQIEQLQLDSMIMAEEGNRTAEQLSEGTSVTTDIDSAEKVNKEQLDLTVYSSLDRMMQGQFYTEEEDEEEEEEEDDGESDQVDREEFILPL